MKKKIESMKKVVVKGIIAVQAMFLATIPVYAADDGVTTGLTALKTLLTSIVTGIGAIVLIIGVFEFAQAWQNHDSSSISISLRKVVSGLIMVGVSAIITLLGK